MRIDKKKPSAGLFRGMKRIKKIQMSRFITAKLKSDSKSESESESESKSDTELMRKIESNSDSE